MLLLLVRTFDVAEPLEKGEGWEGRVRGRRNKRSFVAGLQKTQVFEKIFAKVLTYFACG